VQRAWRVAREPPRRFLQAGVVEVEQRELRLGDGEAAAVEEPAGADADVEVARTDVKVVELEQPASRAVPEEPTGEAEDQRVVEREPPLRLDGDAGMIVKRVCHWQLEEVGRVAPVPPRSQAPAPTVDVWCAASGARCDSVLTTRPPMTMSARNAT
jgi:hypothetical protein